jgi:hypothetical protein
MFYGNLRKNTLERLQAETNWWTKKGGTYFPHWKNCLEYFRSVKRISPKFSEKFMCNIAVFDWLIKEGRRFLAKDILLFLLQHSRLANLLLNNIKGALTPPVKNKLLYLIDIDWT